MDRHHIVEGSGMISLPIDGKDCMQPGADGSKNLTGKQHSYVQKVG